jgi:hypothetical protein
MSSDAALKATLKSMVKLHESIYSKAKELRTLRKQLKECKEKVGKFMKKSKLDLLNLGTHQVSFKTQAYAAPLSKDFLSKTCTKFLSSTSLGEDSEIGKKLVEFIWSEKKTGGNEKDRVGLKRLKAKKSKKRKSMDMQEEQEVESTSHASEVEDPTQEMASPV